MEITCESEQQKKLWDPSKESQVLSLHFVGGQPTELNPNPILHMGYDLHKKVELLSPVGIKTQIQIQLTWRLCFEYFKEENGTNEKDYKPYENCCSFINMSADATEITQKRST